MRAAPSSRWLLPLTTTTLLACAAPPAQAPPAQAPPPAVSPPAPRCDAFQRPDSSLHLSKDTLDRLAAAAREMDTGALVVVEDGKVVLAMGDPERRFELMSVTKSVASVVVGQLIDRKLARLDQPLADFIPAWKGTPKEQIQLHHILEHSSGLDDKPSTEDIYASSDFVQFAVSAELKHPPGTRFFYSNRAANLLAEVVKRASGKALDAFAREELFEPIGIHDLDWSTDKAGNVQVMAGLQLHARDFARIGQLLLDGGRACGKQVVSEAWIRASTGTYQPPDGVAHGLFWWLDATSRRIGFSAKLFEAWRASGVPDDFIDKLRPLEGQYFEPGKPFFRAIDHALSGETREPHDKELEPWYQMTWKAGRPDGEHRFGPIRAIVADGYGGQALIVYPAQRIVVARLRDVRGPEGAAQQRPFLKVANEILLGVSTAPKE